MDLLSRNCIFDGKYNINYDATTRSSKQTDINPCYNVYGFYLRKLLTLLQNRLKLEFTKLFFFSM